VAPGFPGFTVEVLPQIDSSSTELMRRCRTAVPLVPALQPPYTESARTRLNSLRTSARIHWCAGSLSVLLCQTGRTS